ncbi:MAG: hypothetical protein HY608_08305 [Planctomycetes bacterium]|nr:hypothetical protein [Planctomycetota bacterium]
MVCVEGMWVAGVRDSVPDPAEIEWMEGAPPVAPRAPGQRGSVVVGNGLVAGEAEVSVYSPDLGF